MRYLVKARVKPGREQALLRAIRDGSLGRGSIAGDEYLHDMQQARTATDGTVAPWAMMAAAIAAGLSTLAAGYAVAMVGSAAVGALAEKPELLGRVLILVGLAEGIAIYGLIVAVLILNRAG